MPTSLGGHPQGIKLMVKNASATVTIKKGTIVAFSSVAASNPAVTFLDGTMNKDYGTGTQQQIDIPYITVSPAGADSTTPGGICRLGVVAADIKGGGFGEAVVFGLAQVLFGGTVGVGEVITSDAAGLAVDAANASHDNPMGIAMQAGSVAIGLSWCFVNCLSIAGIGAAANTAFMGKGY